MIKSNASPLIFLLISFFVLSQQAQAAAVHASVDTSLIDSIWNASLVVQVTLLLLVSLSVLCWGIGLAKSKEFSSLVAENEKFLNRFYKNAQSLQSWEAIDLENNNFRNSSLARIFRAGFQEIKSSPGHTDLLSLERTLRKVSDWEISKMESRLTILATTGSTGPFIGLFGTVWGIMGSFHKIGQTGSASLAVVAPGISEALITTAVGLVAAIPAVVLYNNFIAKIKKHEIAINSFSGDFVNYAKKQDLLI